MKILNWEANIRKNSMIMLSQTYIYNLSNSSIYFFSFIFLVPMFCWCSQQWCGLPLEWLLQHLLMPFIAQLSKAFRARTAPREKGLAYQSYGSHPHQIPLLCLDHGGSRRHFDLTLYDSSSPGGGDPGLCVPGLLLLLSHFSRVRLCEPHRRQPTRLPPP